MSDNDENEVAEYEIDDGSTFMLTKAEAEARGAKAVQPANKQVKPSANKAAPKAE